MKRLRRVARIQKGNALPTTAVKDKTQLIFASTMYGGEEPEYFFFKLREPSEIATALSNQGSLFVPLSLHVKPP